MLTVPLKIENGHLIIPKDLKLPANAENAILLVDDLLNKDDIDSVEFMSAVLQNPAYDFLHNEPDLYSDEDLLPENKNPNFIGQKNGSQSR